MSCRVVSCCDIHEGQYSTIDTRNKNGMKWNNVHSFVRYIGYLLFTVCTLSMQYDTIHDARLRVPETTTATAKTIVH